MMRSALTRLCEKHPSIQTSQACATPEEALSVLQKEEFDVLLLDVEMPNMTGFEMLSKLPLVPILIFITSKTEYAYDAFEYQAVDFLKKPITPSRFMVAINKAIESRQQAAPLPQPTVKNDSNDLYVKENGRFYRISPDEILYFENVGDYVKVKTESGSHIIHSTLKGLADRLEDPRFLKVHRSYIVNLEKIKDIEEGSLVIERKVIPVSRAHRADLMARVRVL